MDETNPDWSDLGANPSLALNRLPAGDYALDLRTQKVGEPQSLASAEVLRLKVAPAWFETLWGRIFLASALISLITLIFKWRNRIQINQRLALEALISKRTSDLAFANQQLTEMAYRDALTGLWNRRALHEYLDSKTTDTGSVLIIDIDHFKRLNDQFGHAAGDAALIAFAGTLRRAALELDEEVKVARTGGEEFVCFVPRTAHNGSSAAQSNDLARGADLAHRILALCRTLVLPFETHQLRLSASIGVAALLPGERAEQAIRRADLALYQAKSAGRDQIAAA
jgi:diguanylate cyclase (GGDEF)-like protein